MSLNDILQGVATVAGAGVVIYYGKELFTKYYIPWTKKIDKEFDNHPELDGYRFSDEDKK